MALTPFDRPIPGQSLTVEPGSVPWERPPVHSDPLDALEMYMEKLSDETIVDDVMDMVDIGIPIRVVAGVMLSNGVMEGMHTVDTKILLLPILTAQIKSLADVIGLDYKLTMDDYADKDAAAKKKRMSLLSAKLAAKLDKVKGEKDEGEIILEDTQQQLETGNVEEQPAEQMAPAPEAAPQEPQAEQPVQQEMPTEAPAPMGLMAKGQ
jgi:hypothetical protein